jgi:hypothetical protein
MSNRSTASNSPNTPALTRSSTWTLWGSRSIIFSAT